MFNLRKTLFTTITLAFLTSCGNSIVREFETDEKKLNTDSALTHQFHSVLYYPDELQLDFPGYVVGIEKIPVDIATPKPKEHILTAPIPNNDVSAEDLYSKLVQSKTMVVTHVMQNHSLGNCAIYSAYRSESPGNLKSCSSAAGANHAESDGTSLYQRSWTALTALRDKIDEDISARNQSSSSGEPYTHVLVVVMGWNTNQEEAIRNFNSIVPNISEASRGKFNPLFIGVTWPSMWENSWFDPIYKITSYLNKAPDADEVGLSWLGVLLHQTLADLPIKRKIVLGHSFGARASSMASCAGPAVTPDGKPIERQKIDLLISLQGAYSINRFYPDQGVESLHYQFCQNARRTVLTASEHDKAMNISKWVPFVGDDKTYLKYCTGSPREKFSCEVATAEGVHSFGKDEKSFTYVNADDLIHFNAYKSGGGAHSDIYRIQMGKFLWSAITRFAD